MPMTLHLEFAKMTTPDMPQSVKLQEAGVDNLFLSLENQLHYEILHAFS